MSQLSAVYQIVEYHWFAYHLNPFNPGFVKWYTIHTAGLDTIFIQIYIDMPPGVPGVSKDPKGHKDQYLDVFLR